MWVYWKDGKTIWVGFFTSNNTYRNFAFERTRENMLKAMQLVNYLNGGDGKPFSLGGEVNDARNENQN